MREKTSYLLKDIQILSEQKTKKAKSQSLVLFLCLIMVLLAGI